MYDSSTEAAAHDLMHTRACAWTDGPVPLDVVPGGVQDTFDRGGRNFQRTHGDRIETETEQLWVNLFDR